MKTRILLAIALFSIAGIGFYLWSGSSDEDKTASDSSSTSAGGITSATSPSSVPLVQDLSSLAGRVLQDNGQELAGASIQLVPQRERSTRLRAHDAMAISDDQGGFVIADIPPGDYVLSASAAGFLTARQVLHVEANKDMRELVLQLEAGGHALSGEVRDLTGGTIAAAIIHVLPMSTSGIDRAKSASAQTNEEGRYELNLAAGRYIVQAMHSDYVPKSQLIEVSSGAQTLDFGLAPGAVVEGVVRHIDTDEHVPGAIVSYATERVSRFSFFSDSVGGGSVRADAQGRFRISGLHSGSLQLSARGDNATTTESTRVPLGIAEERSDVELYVSSAFRVSGKVVDKLSKEALSGIQVSASSEGQSVAALALTNEEGKFEITGLSYGTYRLSGEGGEYLRELFGDQVKVEADVSGALIELARGAMIIGRVEPAGVAEIGVDLEELKGLSPNSFRRVSSDEDGSFEFGPLDPSSFRLQAKGADGSLGSLDVVLPKAGLRDVVISLKESGSVSGRVVDAKGAAVSDVDVKLRRSSGARSMNIVFNGQDMLANSAHTGPDGSFTIQGLKDGNYEMQVLDAQGQALAWADAKKSDATKGQTSKPKALTIANQQAAKGILLQVETRDASIAGTVHGPDGNPAPDVWVTASAARAMPMGMPGMPSRGEGRGGPVEAEDGKPQMETRSTVVMMVQEDDGGEGDGPGLDLGRGGELPPVLTDDKGQFRFEGLRAGNYNLIAEGMRGSARGFSDNAKTDEPATIRLQQLTRIEGSVTIGDKPATSFLVELSGLSRRDKRVRDTEGKFTMHRIDPGRYTLKVRSDEGESQREIEVVAGKATTVALNLEVLTRIRGTLVDESGAPISGAIVTPIVRRDDGEMNIMLGDDAEMTSSEGKFEFGVRPGKYLVIALKPGAGPLARTPLDVAEGESVIDLGTLQAKAGGDMGEEDEDDGDEE